MRDGAVRSTHFPRPGEHPGPCVGLFAPAGMLLVVVLGVLPLMLPLSSAGSVVRDRAGDDGLPAPGLDAARPLHLSLDDLPLAGALSTMSSGAVADATLPVPHFSVAPPERTVRPPAGGRTISRHGPSAISAARIRSSIPPAPEPGAAGARPRLLWPSRGPITSPFGWRIHPIFGTREFHTGIDIAAEIGAPVVSAYSGIVRFVGWQNGYGRLVIIDHGNGLKTAYSHLSAATVSPGDRVERGQQIGRIGSTGWSTGPHLLFEVYENGSPRDPAGYLN